MTKRDGTTVITFCYDALNRQIQKYPRLSGGQVACNTTGTSSDVFTDYDLAGRPLHVRFTSRTGSGVDYAYDTMGRATSETTFGRAMAYQYDLASNRTRVTWPDALYAGYVYDNDGRISAVNENGATSGIGLLVTYAYDDLGRRTTMSRGNGTSTTYSYDNADRLTALNQNVVTSGYSQSWAFGYNQASQLIGRSGSNSLWDWSTTTGTINHTYDGLNRDASIAALSNGYDKNGNLTNDGTRTFSYDAENRLLSASAPTAVTLSYDPTGRLNQSVASSTTTQFLYDGVRLSAEYNGSGTLLRRYVHGVGTDDPLVWYEGSGTTNRQWLHHDAQGSVVAWSNASGGVATSQLYAYGAYGEPQSWGGSRFRYTGQIEIPEAQLYYYKARVYDPTRGWFLQTDPIGYGSDLDLYAYGTDDPLNHSDPSGMWLFPWEIPVAVVGGTDAERHAYIVAFQRGMHTPRGKQIMQDVYGRGLAHGHTVVIHIGKGPPEEDGSPCRSCTDVVGGHNVYIDPTFHPDISTANGSVPASLMRMIWHEIGHAVEGDSDDDGPDPGNNVKRNENPVATATGEPARTGYHATPPPPGPHQPHYGDGDDSQQSKNHLCTGSRIPVPTSTPCG